MSNLYTSLHVSPKKKRCPPTDDETVMTPKRFRTRQITPPATPHRKKAIPPALPAHLSRLQNIQSALNLALSHALATSAVAPTSDTGLVPNVLNHLTLSSSVCLTTSCTLDDLKRLCWLWEWDGKSAPRVHEDSDNPFLEDSSSKPEPPKQWTRGAMGLIITPTTYLPKNASKRVPAYGIGIEVEIDIDRGMSSGMAAVARWTASGEQRLKELSRKLHRWVQLHAKAPSIPTLPLADLPALVFYTPKQSALTQRLASLSPKSPKTVASQSPAKPLQPPSSPSRSVSPTKPRFTPRQQTRNDFAIPFPLTPASLPRHKMMPPPQVPSSRAFKLEPIPSTPRTTASADESGTPSSSRPATPVHQTGSDAATVPSTPTTSRRAALYERIRKRSESQVPSTPSRSRLTTTPGMSKDQLMKLGQEELRRRCLLGRLGGVAESVWMLFAHPSGSSNLNTSPRKRRTLPSSEVEQAVIKSSPVPISAADAQESITLLTSLCPSFLKSIEVGNEEWLEMPATAVHGTDGPSSPSRRPRKGNEAAELKSLSPKRVKKEAGGLREVRERIKRELEDD